MIHPGRVLALLLALPACGGPPSAPQAAPAPAPEPALPGTASGFLRELLPLPSEALVVVYDLEGPGGLSGSLEILARPGGLRRENWRLELPVPGRGQLARRATRIVTPARMWAASEGAAGTVTPLPLARLAGAYEDLDPSRRRAVIEAVRAWYGELARARHEHPGQVREVAGVTCTWMRVAAQSLCMWEEAGLPLRYEGPALTAEAVRIDRAPTLSDDAFDLPHQAATARNLPPPEALAGVGPELLERLAAGDVAPLALTVQPGFRPPLDLDASGEADAEGEGTGASSAGQVHP